jgi:hypothetical protein
MPSILDTLAAYDTAQADVYDRDESIYRQEISGDEGLYRDETGFLDSAIQGASDASDYSNARLDDKFMEN